MNIYNQEGIPAVSKYLSRKAKSGDITALKKILKRNVYIYDWRSILYLKDCIIKREMLAWCLFADSLGISSPLTVYPRLRKWTQADILKYELTREDLNDEMEKQIKLASKWFRDLTNEERVVAYG